MTAPHDVAGRIQRQVRIYAWVTVVGVLYGVVAAHGPGLYGIPWTTCNACSNVLACKLFFHLYEVPIVAYQAYLAWYGLRRFSPSTAHTFSSLLSAAIAANLAFATFEAGLMMSGLQRDQPLWEMIGLTSVTATLLFGAGFGVYVKVKVSSLLRQ